MTELDELKMFLTLSVGHLPILIASIVALVIVGTRRQEAPEAARWALMGFGLFLGLSLVVPLGQAMIQAWIVRGYHGVSDSQWVYGIFSITNALLNAAALIFLLVAVFADRSRLNVPPPFPPV